MPICKHCGKWSGFFGNEHLDCAQAAAQGRPLEATAPAAAAVSRTLTAADLFGVFWAIFFALWAFGITAGIVSALLWQLVKP